MTKREIKQIGQEIGKEVYRELCAHFNGEFIKTDRGNFVPIMVPGFLYTMIVDESVKVVTKHCSKLP
jgi:hypothetical protein